MKTNPDPANKRRRFYGHGIPGVQLEDLTGKLIVVEGADGSGRSTQIARLVDSLETGGHATVQVGLKRSTLVSSELEGHSTIISLVPEGNIVAKGDPLVELDASALVDNKTQQQISVMNA